MEISYDQTIIVVSHGPSVCSEGVHILTKHGLPSTECLINELAGFASLPKSMISIWSSPHPSAIQTAFELSKKIGVEVKLTYRLTDKLSSSHEAEVVRQNAKAYAESLVEQDRSAEPQSRERPMLAGVSEGVITYESLDLDEVMSSDSPEDTESMHSRVLGLVEAIYRAKTASSDKVVYLFTHQSMLDLLLAKYHTQSEGSNIGFVRFTSVSSKLFSRLVPYNDELVTVRLSSLRNVLGEMMEERQRRYEEVSDSYRRQIQAKQTQLTEIRADVRQLADALQSSLAPIKRAVKRVKLAKKPQKQLEDEAQEGDFSKEQSGSQVKGDFVEDVSQVEVSVVEITKIIDMKDTIQIEVQPKILRNEPMFSVYCYEVGKYYGPYEILSPTELFKLTIDASEFPKDTDLTFVICTGDFISSPEFSWKFSPKQQ
jgi:broad specificity phosphatase PhoE